MGKKKRALKAELDLLRSYIERERERNEAIIRFKDQRIHAIQQSMSTEDAQRMTLLYKKCIELENENATIKVVNDKLVKLSSDLNDKLKYKHRVIDEYHDFLKKHGFQVGDDNADDFDYDAAILAITKHSVNESEPFWYMTEDSSEANP